MAKNHCVAICKDLKGNCIFVAKVRNVDDRELAKLLESQFNYQDNEKAKIVKLEKEVWYLKLNLKLDRGEITKEEYDSEVKKYE